MSCGAFMHAPLDSALCLVTPDEPGLCQPSMDCWMTPTTIRQRGVRRHKTSKRQTPVCGVATNPLKRVLVLTEPLVGLTLPLAVFSRLRFSIDSGGVLVGFESRLHFLQRQQGHLAASSPVWVWWNFAAATTAGLALVMDSRLWYSH